MAAMAISGSCALLAGALFGAEPWLLLLLCLVWGISVVADSAQFSSSVIELSEQSYIGTMLTMQTSIGFMITLATTHLIPYLGVLAMARLRVHPDSVKLANGNR